MSNRRVASVAVCAAMTAAVSLGGCVAPTILSDGQPSAMDAAKNSARAQLVISAVPTPTALTYKPLKNCSFKSMVTPLGAAPKHSVFQVSARRVKDRLLFVETAEAGTSTILTGENGKIYDFNKINPTGSTRTTSETYAADSQKAKAKYIEENKNDRSVGTVRIVNDISLVIPEYTAATLMPGAIASIIKSDDGAVWANYRYRGTTQINGSTGLVLDLTRVLDNNPGIGPVLIGFNVVDTKSMLPFLMVLDAGQKVHIEQVSCAP